ncbi:MAG: DUF3419 family protein [Candidatus Longimicrobiales bacterium M2_2A_002]
MRTSFDRSLNYSSVNEDWDTELRALEAGADDVVLCVTGSGARPLALVARTDATVVAIDRNPAQNHLLRLLLAAAECLEPGDVLGWVGVRTADRRWRLGTYDRTLARRLPPETREWWSRRTPALAGGVVYAGRWERHFRRVSRLARRIWPVDTLFSFDDLEEQQIWLERHWDDWRWQAAWRIVCDPRFSRLVFGDPAFHGPLSVEPGLYIRDRMRRCLETHLARDSFMVSLVLRGELSTRDLPPHLTEAGLEAIKEWSDRLRIVDDDVASHLAAGPQRYTRFSLSDVPSYLDGEGAERLWRSVVGAAEPGARVVVREFLRRHPIPPGLPLRRETGLEDELARIDRSFAYDFMVAVTGEAP